MADQPWARFELRADFIPKDRYLSRDFLDLEFERLWPRVWQVACREEELAEPGAYVEYTIGDQSLLLVRVDAGTVKAFFNACRHRGARLAAGCGRFEGRTITCPYHGWAWRLDGSNARIVNPEQFSAQARDPENLRLPECRVGHWGGFVFVNMDPDAPDLHEFLAPATGWLDPLTIERMGVLWHKQATLPVNWKTAFDAFNESYHVLTTHPEYRAFGTDADAFAYYQDDFGHSHYAIPPTSGAPIGDGVDPRRRFLDYIGYNVDEIGAMYTERDREIAKELLDQEIPSDSSIEVEYTKALYARAARENLPLPTPAPEAFAHIGINYVFPHLMFLPTLGNSLCYRARPDPVDPESTIWDVWSLTIFPDGEKPTDYPSQQVDWRDESQVGRVLFQDFRNLYEVRIGMRSRGFRGLQLNTVQERNLLHMQREIDRYLRG